MIDLDRLEQLLDHVPVGFVILDRDLTIVWVNEPTAKKAGVSVKDVIGAHIHQLIPESTERNEAHQLALSGQSVDHSEDIIDVAGELHVFQMNYRPLSAEDGRIIGLCISGRDITKEKRVEQEIRRSEAQLRAQTEDLDRLLSLLPDMVCIASQDGYFRRINPAFENTLGYTAEELLSKPFLDFVHPDDVEATLAEMDSLNKGEPTINFENRYRCRDGSYKWLQWRALPVPDGNIYAIARETTAQKLALMEERERQEQEHNLRTRYVQQVLSVQDEERRRLARELHDETGSSLTSLVVGLRSLSAQLHSRDAQQKLASLREIADQTMHNVSRLARGLHPSALEDLGFQAALERYTDEYAAANNIQMDVVVREQAGVDNLPWNTTTALYRIVQESLANVSKHAKADSVSIVIDGDGDNTPPDYRRRRLRL